ncbi:unnamed protein product [Calypogeia fissa]
MDRATANTADYSCPICTEEMDYTDRHFNPCRCGYQVCVWCWHQIMEVAKADNTEGRCPACRSPYDKEKVIGTSLRPNSMIQGGMSPAPPNTGSRVHQNFKGKGTHKCRKDLTNVRVVQRNLACVMGLPLSVADEETLERRKFFGQYGRILKLSISKATFKSTWPRPSASVFVTFRKVEDASKCIEAVDGCLFEGEMLRACFGTTKYCNSWLKNMPCNNPDCLFLHDIGFQEDSVPESDPLKKWGSNQTSSIRQQKHGLQGSVLVGLPPPLS